jgi:hypothetical protein
MLAIDMHRLAPVSLALLLAGCSPHGSVKPHEAAPLLIEGRLAEEASVAEACLTLEGRTQNPEVAPAIASADAHAASVARIVADRGVNALGLERVTLARAAVMAELHVAADAERLAERIARSFGWFEGLAGPLVQRVTSEMVAASLDRTAEATETRLGLPGAAMAREACRVWGSLAPGSSVGRSVLRRTIARFASSRLRSSGLDEVCATLRRDTRGGVDPCQKIAGSLDLDRSTASVVPPAVPFAGAPEPLKALQADALARAVTLCGGGPLCTPERLSHAASALYLADPRREDPSAPPPVLPPSFDAVLDRLSRMEGDLGMLAGTTERLTRELEQGGTAHGEERRRFLEALGRKDTQLHDLERRVSRLALEVCQKRIVDEARALREELAVSLGLVPPGARLCEGRPGDERITHESKLFYVERAAFCNVSTPVTLHVADETFGPCGRGVSVDPKKDAAMKKLFSASLSPDTLEVHGYTDVIPVTSCVAEAEKGAEEAKRTTGEPLPAARADQLQLGLSYLRARALADALFGAGARVKIVPHGAKDADPGCTDTVCGKRDRRAEVRLRSWDRKPLAACEER